MVAPLVLPVHHDGDIDFLGVHHDGDIDFLGT